MQVMLYGSNLYIPVFQSLQTRIVSSLSTLDAYSVTYNRLAHIYSFLKLHCKYINNILQLEKLNLTSCILELCHLNEDKCMQLLIYLMVNLNDLAHQRIENTVQRKKSETWKLIDTRYLFIKGQYNTSKLPQLPFHDTREKTEIMTVSIFDILHKAFLGHITKRIYLMVNR